MVIDRPYNESQSYIEVVHLQLSSSSAAILLNFFSFRIGFTVQLYPSAELLYLYSAKFTMTLPECWMLSAKP